MSAGEKGPTKLKRAGNVIVLVLAVWSGIVFWIATTRAPFGAEGRGGVGAVVEGWAFHTLFHPVAGYLALALAGLLVVKELTWRDINKRLAANAAFLSAGLLLSFVLAYAMFAGFGLE